MTEAEKQILKRDFLDSVNNMTNFISDPNEIQSIAELWNEVFIAEIRLYSIISKVLFEIDIQSNDADEKIDVFKLNVENLKVYAETEFAYNYDFWNRYLDKILDHVDLTRTQINRMNRSVIEARESLTIYRDVLEGIGNELLDTKRNIELKEEAINKLEEELAEVNLSMDEKIESVNKEYEKLTKSSKNIQKDFVAILGIFASILLAAFGGLNILQNILSNINDTGTGKVMIFGSFSVLGILMIVFLLLNGVSKLTSLSLRSCNCKDESTCSCSIIKKHPTIYVFSLFLLSIAFIGVSEYIIDYRKLFSDYSDMTLLLFFSIGFGLFLLLSIFLFKRFTKEVISSS